MRFVSEHNRLDTKTCLPKGLNKMTAGRYQRICAQPFELYIAVVFSSCTHARSQVQTIRSPQHLHLQEAQAVPYLEMDYTAKLGHRTDESKRSQTELELLRRDGSCPI